MKTKKLWYRVGANLYGTTPLGRVLGCLGSIARLLLMLVVIGVVGLVLHKIYWELWGQAAAYQRYQLQTLRCYEEYINIQSWEVIGANKDVLTECLTAAHRIAEENYVFPWQ